MEAVIRLKDCNIESHHEAVHSSEILPPSYLDILVEKCLIYHHLASEQQEKNMYKLYTFPRFRT